MCRLNDWKLIEILSKSLPNLVELSLAGNPDLLGNNQLTESNQSTEVIFPKLKVLEMSNTGIDLWIQIESILLKCPQLTTLTLTKNKLKTLCDVKQSEYPCDTLVELVLDSNLINDWNELQKLNLKFPNLKNFGFVQNPCCSGLDRKRLDRTVIPIMKNIVNLDSKPISDVMRQEAETQFLIAALRSCVAEANVLLKTEMESDAVKDAATISETLPQSLNSANITDDGKVVETLEMDPTMLHIPTLEEFVLLKGALKAMDTVLKVQFPHFTDIGKKHGFPLQYQTLLEGI